MEQQSMEQLKYIKYMNKKPIKEINYEQLYEYINLYRIEPKEQTLLHIRNILMYEIGCIMKHIKPSVQQYIIDDAATETFFKFYKVIHKVDITYNIRNYLYTLTKNTFLNIMRTENKYIKAKTQSGDNNYSQQNNTEYFNDEGNILNQIEEDINYNEIIKDLIKNHKHKDLLYDFIYTDISQEELKNKYNISSPTLRKRINWLNEQLKE